MNIFPSQKKKKKKKLVNAGVKSYNATTVLGFSKRILLFVPEYSTTGYKAASAAKTPRARFEGE